jgi:alpha-amylase
MRLPRLAIAALLSLLAVAAAGRASASGPLPPLPAHWQHGAFMEIFVRAWKDSNGDGVGDLEGLRQTLPYLQSLGIRGLWLMPIQPSADRDHGYATTDYRAIAPEYGTLADFDRLVREARARGIGIIIDYVINHSAAAHPFFADALRGPGSRYRSWYVFSEQMPPGWDIWGKNPWYASVAKPWEWTGEVKDMPAPPADAREFYFGTFGPHMPDFDLRNPEVVDYHLASLDFWLSRGLAGFRLDATPHMIENGAVHWNDQPESRALTRRLRAHVMREPGRYLVCEATAEPQAWGDPSVCGGAFAFGYVHHIVEAVRGKAESVQQVARWWQSAQPTMATFLSNHDIFAGRRLADELDGDEAKMRLAAATYLLQPGTPFVYYGEEIGQRGVHMHEGRPLPGDLPLRSPMSWAPDAERAGFTSGRPFRPVAPNVLTHNVVAQQRDPGSLWHFYRTMIGLRNAHPSIARGSFEHARADGLVVQWQRRLGNEHTLVLINYGAEAQEVALPGLPPGSRLRSLHPAAPAAATATHSLRVAPQSLRVLKVLPAARSSSR